MYKPIHRNSQLSLHIPIVFLVLAIVSGCSNSDRVDISKTESSLVLFVGSYTSESGDDISVIELDTKGERLSKKGGARVGNNPTYLTYSDDKQLLYTVNETSTFNGADAGGITTLSYTSKGSQLQKISELQIRALSPCYISEDRTGGYLFIAGYEDGSLTVVAKDEESIPALETTYLGYPGRDEKRSQIHMAYQPEFSNFLYITDIGQDRMRVYHTFYSEKNILLWDVAEIPLPDKSGPRHFITDSTGAVIYLLNEYISELAVLKRYLTGDYIEVQRESTLPMDSDGENYPADIHASPDGKYLYVTNRGHNSISVFKIVADSRLEFYTNVSCEGDWPRNFAISPDGKYLVVANQRSDNISLFRINSDTGIPEFTGESIAINSPSSIIFVNG
jgi:6-phosphogluconolactonase